MALLELPMFLVERCYETGGCEAIVVLFVRVWGHTAASEWGRVSAVTPTIYATITTADEGNEKVGLLPTSHVR
jgi:hypothetical protein